MQWPDLVLLIQQYAQQEANAFQNPDSSFMAALPSMVNNAELRIYRDIPFAAASGQNTSLQTVAQSKILDLTGMTGQTVNGTPVAYPYPVIVETISVLVGNRWVALQLVSLEYLDMVWPDETISQAPRDGFAFYTLLDNQAARIAPVPDKPYQLRVGGLWRPAPISATNPQTWLADNLPDLLIASIMIEVFGYQRDFGARSDDPQAALSWKAEYGSKLAAARQEEDLRKGLGPDYQAYPRAPLAEPPMPPGPQG